MELTLVDTDFITWQDSEDMQPEKQEPKPDQLKLSRCLVKGHKTTALRDENQKAEAQSTELGR